MNNDQAPILRRLQKLLAIAADTRADPNEAAAAAAQAEKIMRKFQIEHADIVAAELLRAENFTDDERVSAGLANRTETWTLWAQTLAIAVAKLHDCQVRRGYSREGGAQLRFVGYRADAQVARWTYLYILGCMKRDAAATKARFPHASRKNMDAYRIGYVAAVGRSLEEAYQAKRAEMEAQPGSRALVISKEAAVRERFGDMKVRRKESSLGGVAGYGNGFQAGQQVDVTAKAIQARPADETPRLAAA